MFKIIVLLIAGMAVQANCKSIKNRQDSWWDVWGVYDEYVYPGDCNSEPDPGFCYAYFENYYYNPTTNTCEMFVYGGCGGNFNNFYPIEECIKTCVKRG